MVQENNWLVARLCMPARSTNMHDGVKQHVSHVNLSGSLACAALPCGTLLVLLLVVEPSQHGIGLSWLLLAESAALINQCHCQRVGMAAMQGQKSCVTNASSNTDKVTFVPRVVS